MKSPDELDLDGEGWKYMDEAMRRPMNRAERQAVVDEHYSAGRMTLKAWQLCTDILGMTTGDGMRTIGRAGSLTHRCE